MLKYLHACSPFGTRATQRPCDGTGRSANSDSGETAGDVEAEDRAGEGRGGDGGGGDDGGA